MCNAFMVAQLACEKFSNLDRIFDSIWLNKQFGIQNKAMHHIYAQTKNTLSRKQVYLSEIESYSILLNPFMVILTLSNL